MNDPYNYLQHVPRSTGVRMPFPSARRSRTAPQVESERSEWEGKAARRRGRYFFKFAGALFLCSQFAEARAGQGHGKEDHAQADGKPGVEEEDDEEEEVWGRPRRPSPPLVYEDVTWCYTTPKVLTKGMEYCWGHEAIANGYKSFHNAPPQMPLVAAEGAWKHKLGMIVLDADGEGFDRCWRDVYPFLQGANASFVEQWKGIVRSDAFQCAPLELPHTVTATDPTPAAATAGQREEVKKGQAGTGAITAKSARKDVGGEVGDTVPPREGEGDEACLNDAELFSCLRNAPRTAVTPEALAALFKEAVGCVRELEPTVSPRAPANPRSEREQAESAVGTEAGADEKGLGQAGWVPASHLVRVLYARLERARRTKACATQQHRTRPPVAGDEAEDNGETKDGSLEKAAIVALQAFHRLEPNQGWGLACFLFHMNVLGKLQFAAIHPRGRGGVGEPRPLPTALVRASWRNLTSNATDTVVAAAAAATPCPTTTNPINDAGSIGGGTGKSARAISVPPPASQCPVVLYDFVEGDKAWYKEIRRLGGRLCPGFRPFLVLYTAAAVERAQARICGDQQSVDTSVAELSRHLFRNGALQEDIKSISSVYREVLDLPDMPFSGDFAYGRSVGTPKTNGWGAAVAMAHNINLHFPPVNPQTPSVAVERKKYRVPDRSFFTEVSPAFAACFLSCTPGSEGGDLAPRNARPVAEFVSANPLSSRGATSADDWVALVIPTEAIAAVMPAMQALVLSVGLKPPAFAVPQHLLYASTRIKGSSAQCTFHLSVKVLASSAGAGEGTAAAAFQSVRRFSETIQLFASADVLTRVALCAAADGDGNKDVPERSKESEEAASEATDPPAVLPPRAGVPVMAASTVPAAETKLDILRSQRYQALQTALSQYMSSGGGDSILAQLAATDSGEGMLKTEESTGSPPSVPASSSFSALSSPSPSSPGSTSRHLSPPSNYSPSVSAQESFFFSMNAHTVQLLNRFAREVEAVRAAALPPVTLLRPTDLLPLPTGEAAADAESIWVGPPPQGLRKLVAMLRKGFLAGRWLPDRLEMVPSLANGIGGGTWEESQLLCEVHLVGGAAGDGAHQRTAAAKTTFQNSILLIMEGEGTMRELDSARSDWDGGGDNNNISSSDREAPQLPGQARDGATSMMRATHVITLQHGGPLPMGRGPADFFAMSDADDDAKGSTPARGEEDATGEGTGDCTGTVVALRKAHMLAWTLRSAWPPELLVSAFLIPPLAIFIEDRLIQSRRRHHREWRGACGGEGAAPVSADNAEDDALLLPVWQAEARTITSDLESLLTRIFYDKLTRERLEFLGDAFLDFLCATEVLTAVEKDTKELAWQGGNITSSTRNDVLAGGLPAGVRGTILAICGGITKGKTYSDFVEAIFGALTVALWILPYVRAQATLPGWQSRRQAPAAHQADSPVSPLSASGSSSSFSTTTSSSSSSTTNYVYHISSNGIRKRSSNGGCDANGGVAVGQQLPSFVLLATAASRLQCLMGISLFRQIED